MTNPARTHISKHRRRDADGNWIPGKVRVFPHSSLRKLMRAARQGKLPDERVALIERTRASAAKHPSRWLNSCIARRYNLED